MSNDRYQEIRAALAMGPTPGPWVQDGDGVTADDEDVAVAMCCPSDAEAAYIAACDPDTIRELLAERDQLAAALEAALEDAARLDWLERHGSAARDASDGHRNVVVWCGFGNVKPDIRQAIDQARGKGGGEVG